MKIPKRYRIEIGEPHRATILLVGCGGTGSFTALHLARLAWAAKSKNIDIRLAFIDPDRVEMKNVGRQNFCPAEVGRAKAETLATRFGLAFGLDIRAAVEPFRGEMINDYRPYYNDLAVVIGAVDSPAARQSIARGLSTALGPVWWIDAGNNEHSGQVLIGNHTNPRPVVSPLGVCQSLPFPHIQEPGLVETAEILRAPRELSCAELMALDAQSLMINQAMAGWLSVYAYRLLLGRDLDLMATYLDQRTGAARSVAITEDIAISSEIVDAQTRQRAREEGEAQRRQYLERVAVEVPAADDEEERICPDCGGPLAEGRDTIDEEIGEEDIIFCTICDWRMYLDDYEAERAEIEEETREENIRQAELVDEVMP